MPDHAGLDNAIESRSDFAIGVKSSVDQGEISGAVVAVATSRMLRMEALGVQDQVARTPTRLDTIYRVGSMAKMVFTAAALLLLEDKKLRLDDEVSQWIPELANRRVLRKPDSEVDDTIAARRPISVFDVLTYQLGIGIYLAQPSSPLLREMIRVGVAPPCQCEVRHLPGAI